MGSCGAARFNERLVLSLASNPNCLLMDDELNVLPTSSHVKSIAPIPVREDGPPDVPGSGAEAAAELKDLRESLADTQVRTLFCMRSAYPVSLLSPQMQESLPHSSICCRDC